jgi:hypothetical protein
MASATVTSIVVCGGGAFPNRSDPRDAASSACCPASGLGISRTRDTSVAATRDRLAYRTLKPEPVSVEMSLESPITKMIRISTNPTTLARSMTSNRIFLPLILSASAQNT